MRLEPAAAVAGAILLVLSASVAVSAASGGPTAALASAPGGVAPEPSSGGSSGPTFADLRTQTTSDGAHLCPETLPLGDGADLVEAGVEAARLFDNTLGEYAVGCLYSWTDADGDSHELHLEIDWTENEMHALHRACENPGYVGEGHYLKTLEINSPSDQAAVIITISSNLAFQAFESDEAEREAVVERARAVLDELVPFTLPCGPNQIWEEGWPACPGTVTERWVDRRDGNESSKQWTLVETNRQLDTFARRDLQCVYEGPDGDLSYQNVRWARPKQTAYFRHLLVQQLPVDICRQETDLPGFRVSAGWSTDNFEFGLSDQNNIDELTRTFAELPAGRASPCDPVVATSAVLQGGDPGGEPKGFGGYVLVYDERNQAVELADVTVVLHVIEGADVRAFVTHTDEVGLFGFRVPEVDPEATYQLEVRFEDGDGIFEVHRRGEPSLLPTGYTTPPRPVAADDLDGLVLTNVVLGPTADEPDPVHLLEDGSRQDLPDASLAEAQEAARVYANVQPAYAYGRDRLGIDYDAGLPETVWVDPEGNTTHHDDRIGAIVIGRDSLVPGASHPDIEYHEVGHHVHYDSRFGGENNFVRRAGESNHGGVFNPSSADSVTEGWASFYAVLVKGAVTDPQGRAVFDLDGYPVDLQDNDHDEWNETRGERVPHEEWMVAALLWDVMDDDDPAEDGDRVAWGLSRLWGALTARDDVADVRDLYEALKAEAGEPLPGPTDPPTALDELFITHGFYSEANGQAGWQPGEAIGYADRYESDVDPAEPWTADDPPADVRRRPDRFDGPWIDVTVADEAGRSIPVRQLTMVVVRDGRTRSYVVSADPTTGRFPLTVPAGADEIRLGARVPGYEGAPFELSRDDYETFLEFLGPDAVPEVTITLSPSSVEPPTGFRADRGADRTVTLSWSPPASGSTVLVVRQAVEPPASPDDGVVVYEGAGGQVADATPAVVGTTYYAAFTVGPDGGLSAPVVASSEAPPVSREELTALMGPMEGSADGSSGLDSAGQQAGSPAGEDTVGGGGGASVPTVVLWFVLGAFVVGGGFLLLLRRRRSG